MLLQQMVEDYFMMSHIMYLYSSLLDVDSDMDARSHPNLPLQPRMGYSTSLGLGELRRGTFWPLLHIGLESV